MRSACTARPAFGASQHWAQAPASPPSPATDIPFPAIRCSNQLRAQDGLAIELTRARKREAIQAQEAAKRAAEEERERAAKAREAEADASKRPSEAATAAPADGNNGATRNSAGDPVIDLTAEEEDDDDAKPLKSRPSGAKRQREEDDPGGENQPGDALKDGSAASGDGESAKRQKTQGESIPGSATDGQQAISQPDPAALLAALTGAAAGGPNQAQAEPTASGAPANNGNFDLNSMDLSNLDGLPDLSNVDFSAFMNTDAGNMPGGAPAPGAGDAQGQGASNLTGPPADTANTGGDAPAAADTTGAATATQDAQTAQEGGGSAPAAEPGTSAGIAGAQTGSEQNPASGAGADASNPADPGGMGNFAMGDDLSGMNINMSDFGNMNFGDMGMGMGMFGGGDGEGGAGTGEGSGMENIDFGAALQGVDWSNLYNTLAGSGGLEGLGGMGEGGGESGGS